MAESDSAAAQLKADAEVLAARKALEAFRSKHEAYFAYSGRRHPITGAYLVTSSRALDQESYRLFAACVAANKAGHVADAQARPVAEPTTQSATKPKRRGPRP